MAATAHTPKIISGIPNGGLVKMTKKTSHHIPLCAVPLRKGMWLVITVLIIIASEIALEAVIVFHLHGWPCA